MIERWLQESLLDAHPRPPLPSLYNKHVVSFPRAPVLAFPFPQEARLLLLLKWNVHFLWPKFKECLGRQRTQSQAGFGVGTPSHPSRNFSWLLLLGGLRLRREGGWQPPLLGSVATGEPCSPTAGVLAFSWEKSGDPPSIHIPQALN